MVVRLAVLTVSDRGAAGERTDASGDLKQTITASAQGAVAATAAYAYVSAHGNKCALHAMGYALA